MKQITPMAITGNAQWMLFVYPRHTVKGEAPLSQFTR
jgi:uncharacterized protein (DUF1810 family)